MAEPSTVYKLSVLSLLKRSEAPLSNAEISDFFLGREYTDYFNVQKALSDLEEAGLIRSEEKDNRICYHLLPDGEDTLRYLSDKLNYDIIIDIHRYLGKEQELKERESAFESQWYEDRFSSVFVHLIHRKKGQIVFDLTLSVPNRSAAESLCLRWKEHGEELIASLLDTLYPQ